MLSSLIHLLSDVLVHIVVVRTTNKQKKKQQKMELGAVFLFCFVTPAHHMYKHLAFWLNTARLDHSRRFSVWFVLVMNVLLLAMCRNMLSTELKTSRF